MKIKLSAVLTLLLIIPASLFAQAVPPKLSWTNKENKKPEFSLKEKTVFPGKVSSWEKSNLKSKILSDAGVTTELNSLDMIKVKQTVSPSAGKKKSVLLGLGLSALLPGAGEFYGGNILKAAIFFAIEAAGWGTYAYFQHRGNVQTDKFQAYADQYWSVRKYASWLKDQGFQGQTGINPNEPNLETLRSEIMVCESQNFSHTLPPYGSQQFYELIGKYQNFEAGWTNLAHDPVKDPSSPYWYETYHDPVFINYAYDRQAANDYYDHGTTAIMVVVANHILSAADAAWTVSMFNEKIGMKTGLELKRYFSPYTLNYETMPVLNMKVTF